MMYVNNMNECCATCVLRLRLNLKQSPKEVKREGLNGTTSLSFTSISIFSHFLDILGRCINYGIVLNVS